MTPPGNRLPGVRHRAATPRRGLLRVAGGALLVCVLAIGAAGCGAGDAREDDGRRPPASRRDGLLPVDARSVVGERLFAATSPYNRPIGDAPRLHPRSERLVRELARRVRGTGFLVATERWTLPVFAAGVDTPGVDVALTADWSPYGTLRQVPIPPAALPDPEDDGHLVVVDPARRRMWELWQARRGTDGRWSASWGAVIDMRGSGIHGRGLSARGSGFSLLGGVIWPHELERGRIDHALVFSTDPTMRDTFVPPATESDGAGAAPLTLPEGARLQLDPALDLGRLGLSREERIVARALQQYGMYLVDNGSASLTLYAVHPMSFDGPVSYPWPELEPGIARLPHIDPQHLRVLDHSGRERDASTVERAVTDDTAYARRRTANGRHPEG